QHAGVHERASGSRLGLPEGGGFLTPDLRPEPDGLWGWGFHACSGEREDVGVRMRELAYGAAVADGDGLRADVGDSDSGAGGQRGGAGDGSVVNERELLLAEQG